MGTGEIHQAGMTTDLIKMEIPASHHHPAEIHGKMVKLRIVEIDIPQNQLCLSEIQGAFTKMNIPEIGGCSMENRFSKGG